MYRSFFLSCMSACTNIQNASSMHHVQWLALARHNESNDWHEQRRQRVTTHHDCQNALHGFDLGFIVAFLYSCPISAALHATFISMSSRYAYLQHSPQLVGRRLWPRILANDAVRVLQKGSHGRTSAPVLQRVRRGGSSMGMEGWRTRRKKGGQGKPIRSAVVVRVFQSMSLWKRGESQDSEGVEGRNRVVGAGWCCSFP
jgi:hypothetical protein